MGLVGMFGEDLISYMVLVFDRELERVDGPCARVSVPIVLEYEGPYSCSGKDAEVQTCSSKTSSSLWT